MLTDNQLLLLCYLINWGILALLVILSRQKTKNILIHLVVQIIYTIYFAYQLKYNSQGGTALVHWFLWMVFIGIHFTVCLIQLGLLIWRKKANNNNEIDPSTFC